MQTSPEGYTVAQKMSDKVAITQGCGARVEQLVPFGCHIGVLKVNLGG